MNGQRNKGSVFADAMSKMGMGICYKVRTNTGDSETWHISGDEMMEFIDSCKHSPTCAMHSIIDFHLKIANLELPLESNSRNTISSVALNSIVGDNDDSCLLQSIKHEGADILIKYRVYEKNLREYKEIAQRQNEIIVMDLFVEELAKDKDLLEFMNMLAISHSNLILMFEGNKSMECVTLKIPYTVLKKHCKITTELLSIN